MKKNNQKLIIISSIIMVLSFIIFYVGQFLLSEKENPSNQTENTEKVQNSTIAEPSKPPVAYNHISTVINSYRQEIFTLEFDPLDSRLEFKPVLAYDNIFGFEKLSDICKRTGAYAAVNGGFFFEYGDPAGMVAIDGKLLMAATGYDPVFVLDKNGAKFEQFASNLSLVYKKNTTHISMMNRTGKSGDIVIYTDDYGSTNRAKISNTSIRIENNTVTSIFKNSNEVSLKKNSCLISFFGKKSSLPQKMGIKVGDKVNIDIRPQFDEGYQAYECGSMLVKDGKAVVPEKDRWIGLLKNRDPRTAIGIKKDGKVVLIVVDGRQPGYSTGFTGNELADYMLQMGVRDAAILDGGATSQIFVKGSLKNKPSYRGIERPVAGCFILKEKEEFK